MVLSENQTPPTSSYFFFNDTSTTEIYTLSLHDALPIFSTTGDLVTDKPLHEFGGAGVFVKELERAAEFMERLDRKSTRLNSSHTVISYAVFCLKKKKKKKSTVKAPLTHTLHRSNGTSHH